MEIVLVEHQNTHLTQQFPQVKQTISLEKQVAPVSHSTSVQSNSEILPEEVLSLPTSLGSSKTTNAPMNPFSPETKEMQAPAFPIQCNATAMIERTSSLSESLDRNPQKTIDQLRIILSQATGRREELNIKQDLSQSSSFQATSPGAYKQPFFSNPYSNQDFRQSVTRPKFPFDRGRFNQLRPYSYYGRNLAQGEQQSFSNNQSENQFYREGFKNNQQPFYNNQQCFYNTARPLPSENRQE